ncbi:hypothetical protein BSF41_40220 [Flavobacterium sp. ACN2]|nr:hypothetical protein BSF41_40220 [Flavobacterium sp. ACN2]
MAYSGLIIVLKFIFLFINLNENYEEITLLIRR